MTFQVDIAAPHRALPAARVLRGVAVAAWRAMPQRAMGRGTCGRGRGPVTIRLTDARELRALNTRYRGKPRGTDVLTFPYHERGALVGGDLVIGVRQAAQQARARRVTLADECRRLIVHGLCHLTGCHHDTLPAFARMRTIEFETLICVLSR